MPNVAPRRARLSAVVVAALLGGVGSASAATPAPADQLVMFREVGCPYCAQWDHDIGKVYVKTDEGKVLPLREVNLLGARPSDLVAIKDVKYTPTFIVMHCGREIARITGYLGPDQFWGLLDHDVADLKNAPACVS
jgi:thioredoxin-related protein